MSFDIGETPASVRPEASEVGKYTAAILAFAWSPKLDQDAQAEGVREIVSELLREAAPSASGLREALEFYANADTYFAIGFFPDRPCGEFMDDFSETELGSKPGKRARAALRQAQEHPVQK